MVEVSKWGGGGSKILILKGNNEQRNMWKPETATIAELKMTTYLRSNLWFAQFFCIRYSI